MEQQPEPEQVKRILKNCEKRLLIKGNTGVTLEIARLLYQYRLKLIGIEGQRVGSADAPGEVHLELLGKRSSPAGRSKN